MAADGVFVAVWVVDGVAVHGEERGAAVMVVAKAAVVVLAAVTAGLAGALVFSRTEIRTVRVHVADPRAKISNAALPSQVVANFTGVARSHPSSPWPLFHCATYGSPYKVVARIGAPAFILELCTRGMVS